MKENFSIPTQFFSVVLLVITATVSYASFSGEGTPYLFPRLLSIILIVTTIVDLVANLKKGKQTKQISLVAVKQFLPGFILILLYVFLAEVVGFYLSSLLFLVNICAYSKALAKQIRKTSNLCFLFNLAGIFSFIASPIQFFAW